jgi:mono/diheme cytochrome c family protein
MSLGSACGESGPPPFTAPRTLLRIGEAPIEVPAETLNHGQKLFNRYCASCHGYEGGGDGSAARNLDPKPRDFRTAEFLYVAAARAASRVTPTSRPRSATASTQRGMPAWGGMRDADLDALVSYIKTFSPRWLAIRTAPRAQSPMSGQVCACTEPVASTLPEPHDPAAPSGACAPSQRTPIVAALGR